jgi:hypothetical protein
MQHFKEFLIKLQTLDIKILKRETVRNGKLQEYTFYDISHENPFLNAAFQNELKQLKEFAITDILNLSREQIIFQLTRLDDVKKLFKHFWHNYYHSSVSRGSEYLTDFVFDLRLNDIFIAPRLQSTDHAISNENFINDLEDTIKARENILDEFEKAVSKIIEPKQNTFEEPEKEETKSKPVFKEGVAEQFFDLMKDYFSEEHQPALQNLLTTGAERTQPLLFNGPGNRLADAFKQLYLSNLIISCNKAELENWIQTNFKYRDKGAAKSYTEKYLQDIISSNTKVCQSPLLDVKKRDGQFFLSPVERNSKNQKRS